MYFILHSEIESNKGIFCPTCKDSQIKLLDKKEPYKKFKCWNKNCKNLDEPFLVINKLISDELNIDFKCRICGTNYKRDFHSVSEDLIYLSFTCKTEECKNKSKHFIYNLKKDRWEGRSPKFKDTLNFSMLEHSKLTFDNLYDLIIHLLIRENRALSAIEMYRMYYREGLLNKNKDISWYMIGTFIRRDIKQNRNNSVFIEIKQGVFDLRERFFLSKEKDKFDLIKEEYDQAFYEPLVLILYNGLKLLVKKSIIYIIPEISEYLKILNIDEKREFLKSEGFKWRRRLKILNINNNKKKQIFFNEIEKESIQNTNEDINAIIDLDRKEFIIRNGKLFSNNLYQTKFDQFEFKRLNGKEFKELINPKV